MDDNVPPRQVLFRGPAVADWTSVPPEVQAAYAQAMAEAQLLEHHLKAGIQADIAEFADTRQNSDYLDVLRNVTLGGTLRIVDGRPKLNNRHAAVSRLVGFGQVLVAASGLSAAELAALCDDALARRNDIAHGYLVRVVEGTVSATDAVRFLIDSRDRFAALKAMVATVNALSSHLGSVRPDGTSATRMPRL